MVVLSYYLFKDALEIFCSSFPEVEFHHGSRVGSLKQWLCRVSLEDVLYLMGPINDDGFN